MPARTILEIAVDSFADAVAAAGAGADRLELVASLDRHGLTPPVELLRKVKTAVTVPVMVMLRPVHGSFVCTLRSVAMMLNQGENLLAAGADGIVFGVLRKAGDIDRDATAMLVRMAGTRETVFHRAFDLTPDPLSTIDALADRGVSRVLSSGLDVRSTATALGLPTPPNDRVVRDAALPARLERLRAVVSAAAGRVEVMPGGGIRAATVIGFLELGVRAIHSACRATGGRSMDIGEVRALRRVIDDFDASRINA
ncbi:MAG: copper homeostasis protein CutC [Phycisphaerae bacterium]|nr:copper homeostasis protein CutC [Phycisphaerae bacterium]